MVFWAIDSVSFIEIFLLLFAATIQNNTYPIKIFPLCYWRERARERDRETEREIEKKGPSRPALPGWFPITKTSKRLS